MYSLGTLVTDFYDTVSKADIQLLGSGPWDHIVHTLFRIQKQCDDDPHFGSFIGKLKLDVESLFLIGGKFAV